VLAAYARPTAKFGSPVAIYGCAGTRVLPLGVLLLSVSAYAEFFLSFRAAAARDATVCCLPPQPRTAVASKVARRSGSGAGDW